MRRISLFETTAAGAETPIGTSFVNKGIEEGLAKGVEKTLHAAPGEVAGMAGKQILQKGLGPAGWASFADEISDSTGLTHDTKGEPVPMPQMGFELNPIDTYQNSPLKWNMDNALQPAMHSVVTPAVNAVKDFATNVGTGVADTATSVVKGLGGGVFSSSDPAIDRASIPNDHLGW